MMTSALWKFDNQDSFPTNCFPARQISRQLHEGSGSWIVAYAEDQHTKLQTSLWSKHKLQHPTNYEEAGTQPKLSSKVPNNTLNADFLMQRHNVENPKDLCSVNIADRKLSHIEEDDLCKFTNVAYVNAAENSLPLKPFTKFPELRELELPVNGVCNLNLDFTDFPNMQVLDLSYNRLTPKDILDLGILRNLKVLTLTGNGLSSIHPDMARPEVFSLDSSNVTEVVPRFSKLEVLYLDDNRLSDLSTFASLAALPQLRELNLDKNGIEVIPHLKVVGDRVISEAHSSMGRHISVASSGKKSHLSVRTEGEKPIENKAEVADIGSHHVTKVSEHLDSSEFNLLKANNQPLDASLDNLDLVSSPNPPFQNLRLLSITNNRIREEECVLAVAAWPRLKHIVVHNNPIIDITKGEPPLLSYYLNERLGINIHRFEKTMVVPKPHLVISADKHRKVTTQVPRIPKQPVDLLINSIVARSASEPIEGKIPSLYPDHIESSTNHHLPTVSKAMEKENLEENVFLTQVVENLDETENKLTKLKEKPSVSRTEAPKLKKNKFTEFEILLDANDDECSYGDIGIQGNIKLLQTIISHPNLLPSTTDLKFDRAPPAYESSPSRHASTMLALRNSKLHKKPLKQQQLSDHLQKLRDREVIDVEVPLADALYSDNCLHLSDQAEGLLKQVEKNYRFVREQSLKATQSIKSTFKETKKIMKIMK